MPTKRWWAKIVIMGRKAENDELDSIKTIPIPRKGAGEMLLMRQVTETETLSGLEKSEL